VLKDLWDQQEMQVPLEALECRDQLVPMAPPVTREPQDNPEQMVNQVLQVQLDSSGPRDLLVVRETQAPKGHLDQMVPLDRTVPRVRQGMLETLERLEMQVILDPRVLKVQLDPTVNLVLLGVRGPLVPQDNLELQDLGELTEEQDCLVVQEMLDHLEMPDRQV